MPAASTVTGYRFVIKKTVAANNVIISPASGNIDGAATQTLTAVNSSLEIFSDGTDYWII